MASIKKRKDSYLITVSCGRDKNGKQILKYATFKPTETAPTKIKKEVERFAADFERKLKRGHNPNSMTFMELVHEWNMNYASDTNLMSESCKNSYLKIFNSRIYKYIGNKRIADIIPADIQKIYTDMRTDGKAQGTIKRTHAALSSVFKYAFKSGLIDENILDRVIIPKTKKAPAKLQYFTFEQCMRFLEACSMTEYVNVSDRTKSLIKNTDDFAPLQYKCFFELAIFGGFRRGEILALTWKDVDFKKETIRISKAVALIPGVQETESKIIIKDPKTVSGNRIIKIPGMVLDDLKEWEKQQKELKEMLGSLWNGKNEKEWKDQYIFIRLDSGELIHPDTMGKKFKTILHRYNDSVEEGKKLPEIRLHDLRHTQASILISEGLDIETVSHRLGHSKASTTMNIYGHWMEEAEQRATNILDDLYKDYEKKEKDHEEANRLS